MEYLYGGNNSLQRIILRLNFGVKTTPYHYAVRGGLNL